MASQLYAEQRALWAAVLKQTVDDAVDFVKFGDFDNTFYDAFMVVFNENRMKNSSIPWCLSLFDFDVFFLRDATAQKIGTTTENMESLASQLEELDLQIADFKRAANKSKDVYFAAYASGKAKELSELKKELRKDAYAL